MKKQWFEVSRSGLRELQAGKAKSFVLRELIQNAWDEATRRVDVSYDWTAGRAEIRVADDSPTGFRDLSHAYTLYAPTYKRADAEKRGRFNLGEKEVLAVCDDATIATTTGTLVFDKKGRRKLPAKRTFGSVVTIHVRMTRKEFDEMRESIQLYLPPAHLIFRIGDDVHEHRSPDIVFETTLATEIERDGALRKSKRKTKVHCHSAENGQAYLYELGIPVCEIDCRFGIDVQQKVPLSYDRESVSPAFLRTLFAEVLNHAHEEICEDEASDTWVRVASSDKRVSDDAIRSVVEKRFGKDVVVATPSDPNANDAALAHGFRVVRPKEFSAAEWENVRRANAVESSSKRFGMSESGGVSVPVKETDGMKRTRKLVKLIAAELMSMPIAVHFRKWSSGVRGVRAFFRPEATPIDELTPFDELISAHCDSIIFNVEACGVRFFNWSGFAGKDDRELLRLILHELAHKHGNHTEHSYHDGLTEIAVALAERIQRDPEFLLLEVFHHPGKPSDDCKP